MRRRRKKIALFTCHNAASNDFLGPMRIREMPFNIYFSTANIIFLVHQLSAWVGRPPQASLADVEGWASWAGDVAAVTGAVTGAVT